MARLFESIGSWMGVKETRSEGGPQECLEYVDESLAVIKPDTPQEVRERAFELAKLKGYDSKLSWPGTGAQFLCRRNQYDAFASALQAGNDTLTFERSKINDEQAAMLFKYFDGYELVKEAENQPGHVKKPFIVLVKK
jgi:hypothetical protein